MLGEGIGTIACSSILGGKEGKRSARVSAIALSEEDIFSRKLVRSGIFVCVWFAFVFCNRCGFREDWGANGSVQI